MKSRVRTRTAFSLLELLAVVTILGIIAALLVPRVQVSADQAKEATCHHTRAEINITVER
jgi:prepilin-type N-terminal cleavage/methylation domain-containing protein